MDKEYIKPQIWVLDIQVDGFIVTSFTQTGEGDDKVLLSKPYEEAVLKEDDDKTKISFYLHEHSTEDDANTCYMYDCEETRIFGRKTDTLDGYTGWYNQGDEGGDCRLFAILDSLSNSKNFNSLYDYFDIEQIDDDSYTVTVKNAPEDNNSATVSLTEVYGTDEDPKYNGYFVVGDLDVVLIDYALNKIFNKFGKTVQDVSYNTLSKYIFGNNKITQVNYDDADFRTKLNEICALYKNGTINNITIGIKTQIDESDIGIITGHAYSLKDYDENSITLINPWDNADALTLSWNKLYVVDPCVIVYGVDLYDEHLVLNNSASMSNTSIDINEINTEVTGWLTSSNADIITQEISSNPDDLSTIIAQNITTDYNNLI